MTFRIILTSGGTAGHVWPIIAVTEALKTNHRVDFLYVGSRNGPEKEIAKKFHTPFKGIFVGKWRNYFSLSNLLDLFKTFVGIIQSFFIVVFFRPQVVFAKGGYVTFPIVFWTKIFKIPLIIHESDAILGKANLWSKNYARKICLGFPVNYYEDLPLDKVIYTGIPLRKELFLNSEEEKQRKNLLITGGSQGSQKINNAIKEILPELLKIYDVYHITGDKNVDSFKGQFTDPHYFPVGFSFDLPSFLRKADLVVSRAGANTLAEISALKKAAILIPLSSAQSDHQSKNAKIYERNNAAVVLSENNLTPTSLLDIINRLMEDDNLRGLLGHHAAAFSKSDSTSEVIDIIYEVGRQYGQRK